MKKRVLILLVVFGIIVTMVSPMLEKRENKILCSGTPSQIRVTVMPRATRLPINTSISPSLTPTTMSTCTPTNTPTKTLEPTVTITETPEPTKTQIPTPTFRIIDAGPADTPMPYSCDCSSDVYNCSEFYSQKAAQKCFDYCYESVGDVHKLDRDSDLKACESLP